MKAIDEKQLREKYGIDNEDWEKTPVSVNWLRVFEKGQICL
jgi:hypothetical protein